MSEYENILNNCLVFSSNALARQLSVIAETCFAPTGLNPSQGSALLFVVQEPEISPSKIAEKLVLAPSTVTRIVEALERKKLVTTKTQGRRSLTTATARGEAMVDGILEAWKNITDAYIEKLGKEKAEALCGEINKALEQLREA